MESRRTGFACVVAVLVAVFLCCSAFGQESVRIEVGPGGPDTRGIQPGPSAGTAWLGVRWTSGGFGSKGNVSETIVEVVPNSPADKAGLRKYDAVVAIYRLRRSYSGAYVLDPWDTPFMIEDIPNWCSPGDLVLLVTKRKTPSRGFELTIGFDTFATIAVLGSK